MRDDHPKAAEWSHQLLAVTLGLLVFETLSGLSIWFLGFSSPNQVVVLVHMAIGLVFIAPPAWYSFRHRHLYRATLAIHVKLTAPSNGGKLRVKARLMYRKADQHMLDILFGEDSGLTSPVTTLAEDEHVITVQG